MKDKIFKGKESSKEVVFEDNSILQTLAGEKNTHLQTIEKQQEVKIRRTENGLSIIGLDSDVSLVCDLIEQFKDLIKEGEPLYKHDISHALKLLSSDRKTKLKDILRDKIEINGRKYSIVPKSINQKNYLDAIRANDIVFGIGPAGTGKTYLAMAMAVYYLTQKKVQRIILCRPAVEAGEKLGFLPGDMAEKVNPYLRPLYDALHDMLNYEKVKDLIERGDIEVAPLAFMRGRTLSNAFVILDEAQNTNEGQMKMLLTRLGQESKCVITGDISQIDIPDKGRSGLLQARKILKNIGGIAFTNFDDSDVIRHPLVAKIVLAYDKFSR